jgi:transposase
MESMEKAFRTLKTDLDIFPMRVRKESTIRGILFVFFLSLIMRSALMNWYSLERMLLELEKLSVAEDGSGNITELERTKKAEGHTGCTGEDIVVVKAGRSGLRRSICC